MELVATFLEWHGPGDSKKVWRAFVQLVVCVMQLNTQCCVLRLTLSYRQFTMHYDLNEGIQYVSCTAKILMLLFEVNFEL